MTWLKHSWKEDWLYALAMIFLLVCFVIWGETDLGRFVRDTDEGINLMKARMLQEGCYLYRDIWSDQPPLFTIYLAGAFNLFGTSVHVARSVTLAFAVLGLIATAWIARMLGTKVTSLAAVVFLVFSPRFLGLARAVMIGLPAMSLGVLALAFATKALQTRRRGWLLIAGLLFAVSLLTKLIGAFLVLPFGMILWFRVQDCDGEKWRRFGADMLSVLFATGIPLLTAYCLFDGPLFAKQITGTYLKRQQVHPFRFNILTERLTDYVIWDGNPVYWVAVPLALYGLILAWRERTREGMIVSVWFLTALVAVLSQTPFRARYLFILAFPLAGLLAIGLEDLITQLSLSWIMLQRRWFSLAVGAVILTAFVGGIGGEIYSVLTAEPEEIDGREQEATVLLRSLCKPGDYIISDQGMFAFRGEFLVPPNLSVISGQRIDTGNLTARELIQATRDYGPRAIVFWEDRLLALQKYTKWVGRNYCLVRAWDTHHQIYTEAFKRSEDLNVRIGNHFLLAGWRLAAQNVNPKVVSADDTVILSLRWHTLRPTDADYHIFVHLGEKTVIAQQDGRPRQWEEEHPTYRWEQGEEIVDTHVLTIPPDAPEGYYPLWVGMYDIADKKRLPMSDAQGRSLGPSLLLTHLRVGEPQFEMPDIPYPQEATLGEQIRFLGYDLPSTEAHANESIGLTLYWQCLEEMSTSYTVFTHLLDHEGRMWGQGDSIPHHGDLPTSEWVAGEVIVDSYQIPVASGASPGVYTIEIGMYDAQTGERLPAADPSGNRLAGDRIVVSEVMINE